MAQPETSATGARWAGESAGGVNQGPTSEAGGCRQRTVRADQRHSIRPGWSRHRDGGGAQGAQRGRRHSPGGGAVPGQLRDLPPTASGWPPPERRGCSRALLQRPDTHCRRRVHPSRTRITRLRRRRAQATARRPGTATCRAGATAGGAGRDSRTTGGYGYGYQGDPWRNPARTIRLTHADSLRQPPQGHYRLHQARRAGRAVRCRSYTRRASYGTDRDARKRQDSAGSRGCRHV